MFLLRLSIGTQKGPKCTIKFLDCCGGLFPAHACPVSHSPLSAPVTDQTVQTSGAGAHQTPQEPGADEKADADRKAWSKAEKGYKKRDPDGFKETKERVEEEKEALREQFEDELERQEKLRKHRMGVRH